MQADVSDEAQVKTMFARVIEEFGSLDVLVNNAGIQKPAASHEIETSDFDRVLAVNLRGPFLCSREAIRHFLIRGGRGVILNNSSVHEIIPKPKYLPYSISKGGMENLTKSLALEYAGQRHPREFGGPGRGGDADQQGLDRQPEGARRGGEPHPDVAPGCGGRDRIGVRVPGLRRRILRHRPNDFRLRRTDALSGVPGGVVVGRIGVMELQGKVVLITGAKGGLGTFVTNSFLEAGARVFGVSRSIADADFPHPNFSAMPAELRTAIGPRQVADGVAAQGWAHRRAGPPRWAFAGGKSVAETDDATLDKMLDLNLRSAFHVIRAVLPIMRAQGSGRIFASGAKPRWSQPPWLVFMPRRRQHWCRLIRTVARENADQHVSANIVLPGTMDTPANRAADPNADFSKWVHPCQVAKLLVHLVSDQASQVSGAVIPIYGGEA